ncbi:putative pavine N-methyltransferase [Rosa chinensis]|uniref:Putative pavine N-methyltransferase n=1 Tax=Rosa chinensis TaxID=74649 RepID=A0A2P6PD90_ROSCH|nr:putative pavine N-methyltransferase [Rosa chinensis]
MYNVRHKIKNGHIVLDVGCGWGSPSLYIAQKYKKCKVTGICISATHKAFIEEQCRNRQLENVKIIIADISTFEIEASYDRIFCSKCLRMMFLLSIIGLSMGSIMHKQGKIKPSLQTSYSQVYWHASDTKHSRKPFCLCSEEWLKRMD